MARLRFGARTRHRSLADPARNGPHIDRTVHTGIGLEPTIGRWDGGENGHAGVAIDGDRLVVVYQGRRGQGRPWSCGSLTMQLPR